ncbi:unnamed protein product, partial [Ixodes hexagonus]
MVGVANSLSAFRRSFREEFLPPGYDSRAQRELERRTQHPEGLVEYIRAMQELFNRAAKAAPESERVARIIRQSHPRYHVYLQGRRFESVEDLVRAARGVQDMILASVDYRPPPPATEALEPSCAWSPPARTALERTPPTHRPPERVGAYAYMPRALDILECTRDGDGRLGAASPAGVSVSLNSRPREAPGAWDWSPQGPHLGGSPLRVPRNPERGRLQFPDSERWLHDPRRDLWPEGPSVSREAAGSVGTIRRIREAACDVGVNGATWEPSGRMTPASTADSVATSAASVHNNGPVSSRTRETNEARG